MADDSKGAGIGPFNWTDVEEAIAEVPQSFNLKNPLPKGKDFCAYITKYILVDRLRWILYSPSYHRADLDGSAISR